MEEEISITTSSIPQIHVLCDNIIQKFTNFNIKHHDMIYNHHNDRHDDQSMISSVHMMKTKVKKFFNDSLSIFTKNSSSKKGKGTGFAGTMFDGIKIPQFSSLSSSSSSSSSTLSSSSSGLEDLDSMLLQTLQSLSDILSESNIKTQEDERHILNSLLHATSLHKSLISYLMALSSLHELTRCPALYTEIFSFFSLLSYHSTFKEILVETSLSCMEKHLDGGDDHRGSECYYTIIENIAINADMYVKIIDSTGKEKKETYSACTEGIKDTSSSSSFAEDAMFDMNNMSMSSLISMVIDSWNVIKSNCSSMYTQRNGTNEQKDDNIQKKGEVRPAISSSSIMENTSISPLYAEHSEFIDYTPTQEEQNAYESQMANCFEVAPLLARCREGRAVYSFMDKVEETERAVIPNKQERLSRIAKEISELRSNLPVQFSSTIHVICDEDRFDVLKAIIIGPHDTPYANGVFEFDLFLPANYPSSPPMVKLLTTGKGTVRFNPNLYACGKVCLSILGTWHGPGWDRNNSSILQVLVSIQSLILVSDPYFNEPGYEGLRGTREGNELSASYNSTIRDRCLVEAIFNAMLYPPPLFEQSVKLHFKFKCKYLLHQLEHWADMCEYTWSKAKSGSQYIDSYVGVSESLIVRAKNFTKVLATTKKRLENIKEKMTSS